MFSSAKGKQLEKMLHSHGTRATVMRTGLEARGHASDHDHNTNPPDTGKAEYNEIQEHTKTGSTHEIPLTNTKPMETEGTWTTEKGELVEEEHHQLAARCASEKQGQGRRDESSSKETQLEVDKENMEVEKDKNMGKETCNRVKHKENRTEARGRDKNQMDQIENEVTETVQVEAGRESTEERKRKETTVLETSDLMKDNGLEPTRKQTNDETGKKNNKEPSTDQEKDGEARENAGTTYKVDYGTAR